MKFSFIIPARNEEGYINSCIEAIKNQSEKPFEIVIVDNGSKDKTVEIAKGLGARVVKERKKGISHARNKGAKAAKGDIVCFVDADCIISKWWTREAKKALEKKEVLAVDGLIVYGHKNPIKVIWYNLFTLVVYLGIVLSRVILGRHFFTGNNMAIKKDIFWKLGGFEPIVAEQVWLSRKFWRLSNSKASFSPKMLITSSSRGFDSAGYLRTIFYWARSALMKIPQDGYSFQFKKKKFDTL